MTSTPLKRARRSLKYLQFDLKAENRVRYGSLSRERMSVSDSLDPERFRNIQDWVKGAGVNTGAYFRASTEQQARQPLVTADGIHRTLARGILIALACFIVGFLLVELGAIGVSQASIRKLNEKIAAVEERNEQLRQELMQAAGDVSVCTEAIRLNLISSGGARSIVLTAPEGASLLLAGDQSSAAETTEEPELRAMAGE